MQRGYSLLVMAQDGCLRVAFQLLCALMGGIQGKDMVGRRQHHFAALGQDHRLQDIDHLRNVGHADGVAVVIEDVQVDGCHQRIAHRVLLIEEARICARLHIVPGAPLVHSQTDFAPACKLADDAAVVFHQLLHAQRLVQGGIVFALGELCRGALVLPILMRQCVVVQRHSVNDMARALEHGAGPVVVIDIRARCNLINFVVG